MARTEIESDQTTAPPQVPIAPRNGRNKPRPAADGSGRGRPPHHPPAEEGEVFSTDIDQSMLDQDIWAHMAAYPLQDWGPRIFAYVFRCAPVTDRTRTGKNKNLQTYAQPFTSKDIMTASWGGSGGYKIILNRYDPVSRQTSIIRQDYEDILNMDFPPRVPLGDWMDDPKNTDWAWCKPMLEKQAAAASQPGAAGAAPAAGGEISMLTSVMGFVERFLPKEDKSQTVALAQKVIEVMQNQAAAAQQPKQGNDPILAILLELIRSQAAKPVGNDPMVTMLLDELKSARAEASQERAAVLEILKTRANGGGGVIDQLKELGTLKDTVRDLFGRESSPPKPADVNPYLDMGLKILDKAVDAAPGMLQAFAMGRMASAGRRPAAGQVIDARPMPAAGSAAAGETGSEETHMQAQIRAIHGQVAGQLDMIAPVLVDYFVNEESGMRYREYFLEQFGLSHYRMVKQLTPETLQAVLEMHKTHSQSEAIRNSVVQLQPADKVLTFIKEFYSDAPAEEEDEDESQPDQAAAQ